MFAYIAVKRLLEVASLCVLIAPKKRKLVDALRRKQIKAQSNKTANTFKDIYEEVTKYNEEHGTNYSYGYYIALKFRGLI